MRKIAGFLFAACLLTGTALADTTYTFSGMSNYAIPPFTGATFTLTTPSPIVADSTFTSAQLTCSFCTSIDFYIDAVAHGFTGTSSQMISYGFLGSAASGYPNNAAFFYFDPGSFTTDGTYSSIILGSDQFATLTVASSDPQVTPEPSSFLLLGSGLLSFAGVVRRKIMGR